MKPVTRPECFTSGENINIQSRYNTTVQNT